MSKKKTKKSVKKAARKAAKKSHRKPVHKKAAPKKKPVKKAAKKVAKKAAPKKVAAPKPAPVKHENSINPYLTFPGNCEEAFHFYRAVFGGNFGYVGRFKEMPPSSEHPMSPEQGEKIMHISLPIGHGTVLFGSDSSEEFGHSTTTGNNFSISVNAKSHAEADHLFNGLSNGGHVTMPMTKQFWGSYFGMCTDKYGIQWMVSYEEKSGM